MEADGLGLLHAFVSLVLALGLLMVPVMVLPFLPLTRGLRIAATAACLAAAVSAASMVLRVEHTWAIVIVDVIQAAALMWFIVGAWELLRSRREREDD